MAAALPFCIATDTLWLKYKKDFSSSVDELILLINFFIWIINDNETLFIIFILLLLIK